MLVIKLNKKRQDNFCISVSNHFKFMRYQAQKEQLILTQKKEGTDSVHEQYPHVDLHVNFYDCSSKILTHMSSNKMLSLRLEMHPVF